MNDKNQNNFIVTSKYARKDERILGFLCFFCMVLIFCAAAFVLPTILTVASAVAMTGLWMFVVISQNNFYLKVNGTNIKARTKAGKKYEFEVTEIEKITCEKSYRNKQGFSFYLYIHVKNREICLEIRKQGVPEIAGYFLRMRENGALKKGVITARCAKELALYRDGHYIKTNEKTERIIFIFLTIFFVCSIGMIIKGVILSLYK